MYPSSERIAVMDHIATIINAIHDVVLIAFILAAAAGMAWLDV